MHRALSRRHCLAGLAAAAVARPGWAQAWPTRPIRIVVPFPAGGATDALARLLAEKMAPRLGQPVVVDNKAGAAGIVGTDAVAKAAPDGYTIVLSLSSSLLTNQFLFEKLPYNAQRDLALVSQIAVAPLALVVHPSLPVANAQELQQHVARHKGKLSYGSYGLGTYPHLAGSFMSDANRADMTHVPYKGEAAMVQDLLGGQVQMAYASALQVRPHAEAGTLKVLGVTGDSRISILPQVPTLAEQGLKDDIYRIAGWLAVAAPAATPKAVVQRLADEIRLACEQPDVRARIGSMGFETRGTTPEAFGEIYRRELPVWEKLIRQSGVKLD